MGALLLALLSNTLNANGLPLLLFFPSMLFGFFALAGLLKRSEVTAGRRSQCGTGAPGYVTLEGRLAAVGKPMRSPGTATECVWWRTTISKRGGGSRIFTSRDPDERYHRVESSSQPFWLEDGTGKVLVDPKGLEVAGPAQNVGPGVVVISGFDRNDHLVGEKVLVAGQHVFLVGELHVDGPSMGQKVAEILHRWKEDPAQLRAQFDANRDGQIDPEEWEAARRAAREAAAAELKDTPSTRVIARPADGRGFLLGASGPALVRRLTLQLWVCGLFSVGLLAGAAWALTH